MEILSVKQRNILKLQFYFSTWRQTKFFKLQGFKVNFLQRAIHLHVRVASLLIFLCSQQLGGHWAFWKALATKNPPWPAETVFLGLRHVFGLLVLLDVVLRLGLRQWMDHLLILRLSLDHLILESLNIFFFHIGPAHNFHSSKLF